VGVHRYTAADCEATDHGELADYFALRQRVLFEVWFPGSEQVELRSVLCGGCGFMTYLPRPSTQDIEAKYRFLQIHEKSIGGQSSNPLAARWDRGRSERMYRSVSRSFASGHNGASLRILDFGGGDGKLLSSFVERGYACYLVDYNPQPRAGIEKLGDTLDDLEHDASFDVVLCSHVLEHVAEPCAVIDRLARRLRDGGVFYGEVPFEIWKGIPIERDPVTHVNFFNLPNLMAVTQRSGLGIVSARKRMSTYDVWRIEALAVVAQKGRPSRTVPLEAGVNETRKRLGPSPWAVLDRRVRFRQLLPLGGIRRRATQWIRRAVKG
jgi:SAM-dependent methyltransferase